MQDAIQEDRYAALKLGELAALVRQGHTEAFRPIVQRSNQRLFRVARAVLRNDADAEDALQEAYINAFRHIDDFRGNAELTTWLTRIVLNECYRRQRRAHVTVDLQELDSSDFGTQAPPISTNQTMDDPCRCTARAQLRELLEREVTALPDPFRVVFVLRDIEQCSVQETAEALDIPPATVKTRLFRARRLLRRTLGPQLSAGLGGTFPFLGTRCATLTDAVMDRVATLTDSGPQCRPGATPAPAVRLTPRPRC